MSLRLALLAALLAPLSLPAQVMFERTYGDSFRNECYWVRQTADGGYIAGGYSGPRGTDEPDVYVVRTDANGDTLWTRDFGGNQYDESYGGIQTTDGGFVSVGHTHSFGAGSEDAYVIRMDDQGNDVWSKTYGGANEDNAWAVEQTPDHGFAISGGTNSSGAGDWDVYVIRTDSMGGTLWASTCGGAAVDYGTGIRLTPDGGIIVTGYTSSFGAGGTDIYLVRVDASGNTLWQRTYGGPADERGHAVLPTPDSGYLVIGYTESFGAGRSDFYLIKTDAVGDTQWTRTFGDTSYERGYSIEPTADGGYILAGYSRSFGAGEYDVYLIKVNDRGEALWTRTFGGPDDDYSWSAHQTADHGYVAAGSTRSFGAGLYDVYLIKTDSLGRTAVEEPKQPQATSPKLQAEPNPCRGRAAISFQLTANSSAQLSLFDASGRLVLSQPVQTSPFILHPSSLPAGVYLARLDCGALHASTRLVVQK